LEWFLNKIKLSLAVKSQDLRVQKIITQCLVNKNRFNLNVLGNAKNLSNFLELTYRYVFNTRSHALLVF
jgi:hypothetical protein